MSELVREHATRKKKKVRKKRKIEGKKSYTKDVR